jgi:hypothetical protein
MIYTVSTPAELVFLAQKMGLEPAYAVALPAVVENAVSKIGMNKEAFIRTCLVNTALQEYLAEVCKTVIDEIIAESKGDI